MSEDTRSNTARAATCPANVAKSYNVARAAILSIDSAKVSGSSLLLPTDKPLQPFALQHYCVITKQLDRADCVQHLFTLADSYRLPPIVVAETWTPGLPHKAAQSLSARWGLWWAEILRLEEQYQSFQPHIIRVEPNVWRDAILGRKRSRNRDQLKAEAIAYIRMRFGYNVDDNVAEAVAIGLYGAQHPSAHEAVAAWNKRQQRRQSRLR